MTTERAIELLKRISDSQFDGPHGDERREALEMAVRALKQNLVKESGGLVQDLVKDCISRQAAIDIVRNRVKRFTTACVLAVTDIEKLPSAQPEIIRCTECKHYREYDSKYVENAVVVQCMADRYPISEIIPDGWFCAGAERKDDE